MAPQRFGPDFTKNRLNSDGSLYIFRFWPVAALLVFITYFFVAGLRQRADVPRYHQDCAFAWSSPNPPSPTQPCLYKAAAANLITYHHHGLRNSDAGQTVELTYPDSSTASMDVARMDGRDDSSHNIPATDVNGSCWVEIWHGKVTAVLNANHRLTSEENPENKAGNYFLDWFLLLALLVMTIIVGLRIRLSAIRGIGFQH